MSENQDRNGKVKDSFSTFWQKTADIAKKTAEGAKNLAEQTKKTIHEQQAKKYLPVTAKEFKSKKFQLPAVIEIVDNSACREFVEEPDAIGWIERHKEVDVLHMYADFSKKCGLTFVPLPQQDHVYCLDTFDNQKYINVNQIFGKATEEKLAELRHIAYVLGATTCSVEIVEQELDGASASMQMPMVDLNVKTASKSSKMQSGKTVSHFEGHDQPTMPELKWFAHDHNIKGLIEMRCNHAIKSDSIKLQGSSTEIMSLKMACAIDQILKVKGKVSVEKEIIKEHNRIMVFEVEF